MPARRAQTLVCRNCRSRKDISHFHVLTDGKLIDYLCCECVENPQIAEYFRTIMRDHPAKPLMQYGKTEITHVHTGRPLVTGPTVGVSVDLGTVTRRMVPITEPAENPRPPAPKPQRPSTISISITLSRTGYRALAREAERQKTTVRALINDTLVTLYGDEEQSA